MTRHGGLKPTLRPAEAEIRQVGGQTLLRGDCVRLMREMDAGCVDVVVTSPPYNLDLAYSTYDDGLAEADYLAWLCDVCAGIRRVMRPAASFFLNMSGSNSRPYLPFEMLVRLRRQGFCLQNHITWIKSIGMETESRGHFKPVGGKRFMHHNHEHVFHLTLGNDVELDRLSIGVPFQDKTNIARRDHARDLRCRGNTWFLPYSTVKSRTQKFNHPGGFPVELPLWCIYLHGVADGLVLDPFVGAGTTLVAARLAGARGIGIDIDTTYVETARARLDDVGGNALDVTLDGDELAALLKHSLDGSREDGWHGLIVGLRRRTNKSSGHLTLTGADLSAIRRHACDGRNGFRRDCLAAIFGRHLGPALNGAPLA